MKRFLIFISSTFIFLVLSYIIIYKFLDEHYVLFDAFATEYHINDDFLLVQTSRSQVSLHGNFYINPCVYKIGWNEKYIVALQYDMIDSRDGYRLDKSVENYYIINLEDNTMVGPITKDEFEKTECSSIKMKRTYI